MTHCVTNDHKPLAHVPVQAGTPASPTLGSCPFTAEVKRSQNITTASAQLSSVSEAAMVAGPFDLARPGPSGGR
eukprot:3437769-Amphidinium_carterae.1